MFEGIASSIESLKDLIILRLSWWIKGWGDPFLYCSNEIFRNPSCLKWGLLAKLSPGAASCSVSDQWCPPPSGSLKWNVDASSKPSYSSTAIGGVLRDHTGKFLCVFSRPVPFMDINQAEVLAIHRALQISPLMAGLSNAP